MHLQGVDINEIKISTRVGADQLDLENILTSPGGRSPVITWAAGTLLAGHWSPKEWELMVIFGTLNVFFSKLFSLHCEILLRGCTR